MVSRHTPYGLKWGQIGDASHPSRKHGNLSLTVQGDAFAREATTLPRVKMKDIEQAIRERAYQFWSEGKEGHAESHWLAAQREVLGALSGQHSRADVSESTPVAAKPKARKRQRAA
jgi:hypothetical protein